MVQACSLSYGLLSEVLSKLFGTLWGLCEVGGCSVLFALGGPEGFMGYGLYL